MTLLADPVVDSGRLRALIDSRSIAVVGASADPAKITGRPIAYMLARGYTGEIYPVNPGRDEVQGLRSHPSLAAIGKPVECAIIGTAAEQVERVVAEGIAAGVRAFVIFSSGFAETGEAGRTMQHRLARMARAHGVTIVGPNCLGVISSACGLIASFTTALEHTPLRTGAFALVSQSGALGAYWLDIVLRSGLGFSHWITTGNECDVDAAEAVAFLADDPATRVIGLYLEDIHDVPRFRRALQRAAHAGKAVIAIKSGRSQVGADAAASHTGALAGDDALYDACLRQHGALRVDSLLRMIDVARLCLGRRMPLGPRLGVLSVSGGAGVMIADAADANGLTLPAFAQPTRDELRQVLPAFVQPANPVDLTGQVVQDTSGLSRALEAVARDPAVDAVVLFVGMMHSIANAFVEAISSVQTRVGAPIVVIWIGAMPQTVAALEAAGVPVFADIPPAIETLAAALRLERLRSTAIDASLPDRDAFGAPDDAARAQVTLSEHEGKQLLRTQSWVAVPDGTLLDLALPSRDPSPGIPYPVAAKLQARGLAHKSDIGAVLLHIGSDGELADAVERLAGVGRRNTLPVQGVLVEAMVPCDHELLVGIRRDPKFGIALTLARGGVSVELEADAVTGLLPLDTAGIEAMLRGLRCARALEGYRGRPAADIGALARRIGGLCDWFRAQDGLEELEINPLAVRGGEAWALDALAVRSI